MSTADTPAGMLSRLDASLAKHGEDVILRRRRGTSNVWDEVQLRGRLSGYRTNPLAGSTKQTMQDYLLSPTLLNAAVTAGTWPHVSGEAPICMGDELRGEDGVFRRIDSLMEKRPGGVVVRYEGQILG